MKKSLQKINTQQALNVFSKFSNFDELFDKLYSENKKINPKFLTKGTASKEAIENFKEFSEYCEKFLIKTNKNGKFIFNLLVNDEFTVLNVYNSFFNVKIIESFEFVTFSKALLCEKVNKDLPAVIISHISDETSWFIVP